MDAFQVRHRLEYVFFCVVVFLIQSLPLRTAERVSDVFALLIHRLPAKINRRQVAADNIRQAMGDLSEQQIDKMILGMWQHLFRMVIEITQIRRRLRQETSMLILNFFQREKCVAAVLSGRKVIFLGGHFGNWEISVTTFGHFGFPMGVIARDLDNPWLHQWFQDYRESSENWIISKKGGGTDLTRSLETCGMASLLCDQDAGGRGLFVDFFGRPASTFKSIALLAIEYDAMIVVGGGLRLPRTGSTRTNWVPFELATQAVIDSRDFDSPNALQELTQAYTTALEQLIRRAPEQYFWIHRRWKSEPRRKKRTSKKAA
ncbi:MAG: lysophospholipid acyltransferase family protein [Fuerstiella sp.]|nr:lysophospholipid acyltransferase family protein [Fuerstiella sp.]